MKVIWLNDELTDAIVEVGWFRKRYARVIANHSYSSSRNWSFKATDRALGHIRCIQLDVHRGEERCRRETARTAGKEWLTEDGIKDLPRATLLLR